MEVVKSLLLGDYQLQQLVTSLLNSSEQCPEDLLDAEPHPNDGTLVTFADLIYTLKNLEESDADYGKRILSGELFDNGWRCLITANNATTTYGYFGAAFYHSGKQQVVVAHRGTNPKCFGALYTDIQGVLLTNYTTCMNSATTFVDFIRQVIISANNKHRHYTLAITGHSLGAWLAQITTFSVKYLAVKHVNIAHSQICFEKKPEVGIHAKTVGFDSPGARNMLERVLDDYYDRYDRNVLLDELDITAYLSAPNHINTCGVHLGKIYRVFNDVSDLIYKADGSILYTFATHGICNFVKALIIDDSRNIGEVTDWAKSSDEFNKLFKTLNWDNNYHAHAHFDNPNDLKKFFRYKVARIESSENLSNTFKSSFRVFSEDDLLMLFKMHILQEQKLELTILNKFIKIYNLKVESGKLLPNFDLDHNKRTITCESGESFVELRKRLKQLMRWLKPQFTQAVEEQIAILNRSAHLIYYAEGQSYLHLLSTCRLDFTVSDGFKKFLVSDKEQVMCLVTSSRIDVVFQMSRLRNFLHQIERSNDSSNSFIKYVCQNHYTFLSQSQLQNLIRHFGWPIEKEFLMVVDCTLSSIISILQLIKDVNKKDIKSLKLVLIVSQSIDTPESSKICKTVNFCSDVHFSDLTPDSQNIMLNRGNVIITTDKAYSLREFLGDDCSFRDISRILCSESLKNFATVQDYSIEIKDTRPTLSDIQMPFFKLNIKTSMEFFVNYQKSADTNILVMSGLNREDLETGADWHQLKGMDIILAEGDAQLFFRDTCKKNQDKCIYLFEVLGRDVYCKEVFNRRFYLGRKFLHRAYIDVKKFVETEYNDSLFVINSETNKMLLIQLIENCRKKVAFTDNILIAPEDEEVNVINKYMNKRIHFVKICQSDESYKLEWRYSHRSVESLLPYISYEPINEIDLSKTGRNLTIITDEPGMGKTTTLSSLSRFMESPWVIHIELKYFQKHIYNLPKNLTHKSVANFLLSGCGSQANGLLEYLLESKINSKRVVLLLDGFDELDDYVKDKDKASAKENIINLLVFLKNIPTVQIFLTARKYLKKSLENELCNLCTSFVPFCEDEQLNLLVVIWQSCFFLELGVYGKEEEERLKEYAREVLRKAKEVLGTDTKCIMGIPLLLRMLAEVFRPTSDLLLHSPEVLFKQINVESPSNLYKKFISLKYNIYLYDKTSLGAVTDELIIKHFTDSITKMHGKLGFKTFFPDFYVMNFDAIEDRWLNKLNRIGLLQTKGDGHFQFVHRTYAEYCCAEMLVCLLNKPKSFHRYELFKELLVPQILLHPDSKIIRMFMNELLNETKMSEMSLKLNAKCISQLWNEDSSIFRNMEHETILHIAVKEENVYIATLLLRGLKIESAKEAFVSLIKQYDQNNNTAINFLKKPTLNEDKLVLDTMTTNILQHIGACSDETKANIFFVVLFNRKVSNFDITAEKHFFERLFNRHNILYASQASTDEEPIDIINSFYQVFRDHIRCTSRIFDRVKEVELVIQKLTEAVDDNKVDILKNIFLEKFENNVERYCFLLMKHKDQNMQTVLHIAVWEGRLDMIRQLGEQTAVPFTILMAQRDDLKRTPLHLAATVGRSDIIRFLVEKGADINARCKGGTSVVWYAARSGKRQTVSYLVDKGADIHSTDEFGQTLLYLAARRGHLDLVEYFLQQGMDPDRVNRDGKTALTEASKFEKWKVVQLLLDRRVDVNADGGRALSWAIERGEWSMVDAFINKGAAVEESQIGENISKFKVNYPNYVFKKK